MFVAFSICTQASASGRLHRSTAAWCARRTPSDSFDTIFANRVQYLNFRYFFISKLYEKLTKNSIKLVLSIVWPTRGRFPRCSIFFFLNVRLIRERASSPGEPGRQLVCSVAASSRTARHSRRMPRHRQTPH